MTGSWEQRMARRAYERDAARGAAEAAEAARWRQRVLARRKLAHPLVPGASPRHLDWHVGLAVHWEARPCACVGPDEGTPEGFECWCHELGTTAEAIRALLARLAWDLQWLGAERFMDLYEPPGGWF
jgi:hypothetical protein